MSTDTTPLTDEQIQRAFDGCFSMIDTDDTPIHVRFARNLEAILARQGTPKAGPPADLTDAANRLIDEVLIYEGDKGERFAQDIKLVAEFALAQEQRPAPKEQP